MIAHDLQEPVRTSAGFAAILRSRYSSELTPKAKELLDFVSDGLERLRHMIDGLLHYSRVARENHSAGTADLAAALDWAKISLGRAIRESGAPIHSDPLSNVTGDFVRFRELFQNPVGNAIKYRRPDVPPEIRILVKRQGERWKICVEDNGTGIDPRRARELFHPFRRLHGADVPGSGMGLAICRKIVERQGGEIWVEPREVGARFCFTVRAQ